jgi:hypothetical protein
MWELYEEGSYDNKVFTWALLTSLKSGDPDFVARLGFDEIGLITYYLTVLKFIDEAKAFRQSFGEDVVNQMQLVFGPSAFYGLSDMTTGHENRLYAIYELYKRDLLPKTARPDEAAWPKYHNRKSIVNGFVPINSFEREQFDINSIADLEEESSKHLTKYVEYYSAYIAAAEERRGYAVPVQVYEYMDWENRITRLFIETAKETGLYD